MCASLSAEIPVLVSVLPPCFGHSLPSCIINPAIPFSFLFQVRTRLNSLNRVQKGHYRGKGLLGCSLGPWGEVRHVDMMTSGGTCLSHMPRK